MELLLTSLRLTSRFQAKAPIRMQRIDLIVQPCRLSRRSSFVTLVDGFCDREAPECILQCHQCQKSDQRQC